MAKRVAPLKLRKVKKEGKESGSSSDSGTWIPKGEGFGYPSKIFTDPNYPKTSEEEVMETCSHDETNNNITPNDFDSVSKLMPMEENPIPNNIKFDLGPYFPSCTPAGYRCISNDIDLDWDGMVETYHPLPKAEIKQSWFLHDETKKMPHNSPKPSSPKPEKAQTPLECIELEWDTDLDEVSDYLSQPHNDQREA